MAQAVEEDLKRDRGGRCRQGVNVEGVGSCRGWPYSGSVLALQRLGWCDRGRQAGKAGSPPPPRPLFLLHVKRCAPCFLRAPQNCCARPSRGQLLAGALPPVPVHDALSQVRVAIARGGPKLLLTATAIHTEGDYVLLRSKNDSSQDGTLVRLKKDKVLHGHRGALAHNDIISKQPRQVVQTHKGTSIRLHEPTLAEYIRLTPRLVTPVRPAVDMRVSYAQHSHK